MKRVALSQRIDCYPGRGEVRDAADQQLTAFCLACDLLPFPVPNLLRNSASPDNSVLETWLKTVAPEAIILSGGNDIGSCESRDATERLLLDIAELQCLPVLGICRGMQMLASYAGASISPISGHVKTRHFVDGAISRTVNSFHNMALDHCPEGWHTLGVSENNVIEAIAHNDLPWEGWMWHPEREPHFASDDISRCKALFHANFA